MKSTYKLACTPADLEARLAHWARRHGYARESDEAGRRFYSRGRRWLSLLNGYCVRMEVSLAVESGDEITVHADVRAMHAQGEKRRFRMELEQSDILRGFAFGCMDGLDDFELEQESEQGAVPAAVDVPK